MTSRPFRARPGGRAIRRLLPVVAVGAASLALAGCGGGGDRDRAAPTRTQPETTAEGEAPDGATVFAENGCGSCHTFSAAGSAATVGPNLDETLERDARAAGKPLPDFVRESIVDPDAFVAQGFQPGVMPQTFDESLDERDLDALVKFLAQR